MDCELLSAPVACQESPTPPQADPLMGCCVFFVVVVDCWHKRSWSDTVLSWVSKATSLTSLQRSPLKKHQSRSVVLSGRETVLCFLDQLLKIQGRGAEQGGLPASHCRVGLRVFLENSDAVVLEKIHALPQRSTIGNKCWKLFHLSRWLKNFGWEINWVWRSEGQSQMDEILVMSQMSWT